MVMGKLARAVVSHMPVTVGHEGMDSSRVMLLLFHTTTTTTTTTTWTPSSIPHIFLIHPSTAIIGCSSDRSQEEDNMR